MKAKRWMIAEPDAGGVRRLAQEMHCAPLTAAVLSARGIENAAAARAFLSCERSGLHDPFAMHDMDRAVGVIRGAIERGERIVVYGDYDVDGITATCTLVDYLRTAGAACEYYIPNRLSEGYGLTRQAMEELYRRGTRLMITVDSGITANEEIALARELGMKVVITDHHECHDELPEAEAVIDCKQAGDTYPFDSLAGVGVAFKLICALDGDTDAMLDRYADLVALGTVADVMPIVGENRILVAEGLQRMEKTRNIGLQRLLAEAGMAERHLTASTISFVLAPRINAAGRMGEADKAAELLLSSDPAEAARLARELCALNRERQSVEQEIYAQALEMIEHLPEEERYALVLSSDAWHQGVVGIVASRLSEKYACPSFMIHLSDGVGKGSCRSWGGFNLFAALESCQDLLLGFGGHELAAGFTIEEGNIPAFRARMNQYARKFCGGQTPVSVLDVDVPILHPGRVTLQEVEELRALEPYGAGNSRPLFCLQGATLDRAQNVGQNRHLKVRLSKGSAQFDGIFFSATAEQCGCRTGCRVDAAFYLQVNEFRGNRSVQMQIVDIRPSLCGSAREGESLHLMERCMAGETLLPKEAVRLLPSREQFVRLWRMLERTVPKEGVQTPYLPYIRVLAEELPGAEPFLRAAFCLEIFRERGLVSLARSGDDLTLRLTRGDRKISLEESAYLQTLQRTLHATHSGGDMQ